MDVGRALVLIGLSATFAACLNEEFAGRCDSPGACDSGLADTADTATTDSTTTDTTTTDTTTTDSTTTDGADAADGGSPCPTEHGPAMVVITAGAYRYCIDTTEVTVGQWNEFRVTFLTAAPMPASIASICSVPPDADSRPPDYDTDPTHASLPRNLVSWCDAAAYCEWAGKRLCGAIDDTTHDPKVGAMHTASNDEWFYACRNGSKPTAYPYGTNYEMGVCADTAPLQKVGTKTACHGTEYPFSAIYDMSGNLWEWESGTNGTEASGRGGATGEIPAYLACSGFTDIGIRTAAPDFGFRCCANAR